jgi:hypothetical protein
MMIHQISNHLKRIAYLLVLGFIAAFLWRQGLAPWQAALAIWPVMVGVIFVAPFVLTVQAVAFQYCLPANAPIPSLDRLIRIWATASITSFVAPFIAGLAVRATLLVREGVDIRTSSIATLRQTWINVDYAWCSAAVLLVFNPWPYFPRLGYGVAATWLAFKLIRIYAAKSRIRSNKLLSTLFYRASKLPWKAQPWLWGQIAIMGFNYWMAFQLGGAPLSWQLSLLLAAVTILASLMVFIPHGLGMLDVLWVWIANQQGISLNEGVGLAMAMRMGLFLGAAAVWGVLFLKGYYSRS